MAAATAAAEREAPRSLSNGSADSYIGSLISLTSKSEIRYEGILFNINTEESSIGLRNVRSFGTEGRKKDGPQVPPSDKIYEYILFRGSDIKDLQVKSSPTIQTATSVHNDPTIIQTHYTQATNESTNLASFGIGSIPDVGSQNLQMGIPRPTFEGNLPLYQPVGGLGSWGSSPPPPTTNGSGLALPPMYWQGFYGSSNGFQSQQQSLFRPPPGLSLPPSLQQTVQYHSMSMSLPSGASNIPTLNLKSSVLPSSTLSWQSSILPTSSPSLQSSMLPTSSPSLQSSVLPTSSSSLQSSILPSSSPSLQSSTIRTSSPSLQSSMFPISSPSLQSSMFPTSSTLSWQSSMLPTSRPSLQSSMLPSSILSCQSSILPTSSLSLQSSMLPTSSSSLQSSILPTSSPSLQSSTICTSSPSLQSSMFQTSSPILQSSMFPTSSPSLQSTTLPTQSSLNVGISNVQPSLFPAQTSVRVSDSFTNLVPNKAPSEALPFSASSISLSLASSSTISFDKNTHLLPVSDKHASLGMPMKTSESFSAVGFSEVASITRTSSSILNEGTMPSLITPGQLLQHRPTSESSTQSPQTSNRDVHAVQLHGGNMFTRHYNRGRERGRGNRISHPMTRFTEDFDFTAMNEKFNKEEVWGDLGKSSKEEENDSQEDDVGSSNPELKPVYVKDDFFDSLSCDALDRGSHQGRTKFSEQFRKDTETFGHIPRHWSSRGRRGLGQGSRSSGGYYGRGYGRGHDHGYGYVGRGRGHNFYGRADQ